MSLSFLSGGTGTPKLLLGFRELVEDRNLHVVANTGDDYKWNNLHVSPDLDTLLYLFSGQLDLNKFWGRENESFSAVQTLRSLGKDIWFNVGDKDMGLHLYRTSMLTNHTLSKITEFILELWGIEANIQPMCDQELTTIIHTPKQNMHFQEYFVKHKWVPEVKTVEYKGDKNKVPKANLDQLNKSSHIIIGPSNPITSIGPILSLTAYQDNLKNNRSKTVLISPLKGGKAFSGPTAKLMEAMKYDVSPQGLVNYYEDYAKVIILDQGDKELTSQVEIQAELLYYPLELKTNSQQVALADFILESV